MISLLTKSLLLIILICTVQISRADDDMNTSFQEGSHTDDAGDDDELDQDMPEDPDLSTSHKHYEGDDSHHNEDFDHEAVTGSHKDSEEFKDLTPEEAKSRLSVLIKRMDINKDGKVELKELQGWVLQSFQNLDKEKTALNMQEVDLNNDSKISWDEYVQNHFSHNAKEIAEMRKSNSTENKDLIDGIDMDEYKFKLADQNKDGFLSLDEFVMFEHPTHFKHMAPYEIKRTLHDHDSNKDGKIDFKEYVGDIHKIDNETEQAEKRVFEKLDKNKNGFLEDPEILKWVMPGLGKSARKEAAHLLKETDENKDKVLTEKEILSHHDLWVGSKATNYGENLQKMKEEL